MSSGIGKDFMYENNVVCQKTRHARSFLLLHFCLGGSAISRAGVFMLPSPVLPGHASPPFSGWVLVAVLLLPPFWLAFIGGFQLGLVSFAHELYPTLPSMLVCYSLKIVAHLGLVCFGPF